MQDAAILCIAPTSETVDDVDGVIAATAAPTVAVVGLGYVGLPTALALSSAGFGIIGLDRSDQRLTDIRDRSAELIPKHAGRLAAALRSQRFTLTSDAHALHSADAVVICVPTPVDRDRRPDLRAVQGACASVVRHARAGQTIVLTSTTSVGTTRELLCAPLARRGLTVGTDVFVAFSPERIVPGDASNEQESVPRVVGGVTPACLRRARALLEPICARVHAVSSPEAAELAKLHENTFRAVNLAFANEMADVARGFGLDPVEVLDAAASKPYGFLAHQPGPGVGGHCIPCDPYYLLQGARHRGVPAPIAEQAMQAIRRRPLDVVLRALAILAADGLDPHHARVLVVGAAFKPGVRDVRESTAIEILELLAERGVRIAYTDPMVPLLRVGGEQLVSVARPRSDEHDLVILHTLQPKMNLGWIEDDTRVLDTTYRTYAGPRRFLLG